MDQRVPLRNGNFLLRIFGSMCLVLMVWRAEAQQVSPYLQIGVGYASLNGSAVSAGFGVEWRHVRMAIQHTGDRQWGHKMIPPNACGSGWTDFTSPLRYDDRYNETSVLIGGSGTIQKRLGWTAMVGLGRYTYKNRSLASHTTLCEPFFGPSYMYTYWYVELDVRRGLSLPVQLSFQYAMSRVLDVGLGYVGSYPLESPSFGGAHALQVQWAIRFLRRPAEDE